MRRRALLIGAGLVLAAGAAVVAVRLHDSSTPYTADQAVREFRQATASPTSGGVEQVTPGVYAYRTSGHEEVDVLGGSRHVYPAETTITYRRTPCGGQGRWQPLSDRFSTNDVCVTSSGGELRRSFQRHTFFGQADEQDLVCPAGLVLLPVVPREASVTSATCRGKDSTVALKVQVLGMTNLDVGGRRTEVVHLVVTGRLAGAAAGQTRTEEWLTPSGLTVRTIVSVASDRQTPVGTAHYTESYELNLRSLEPQS